MTEIVYTVGHSTHSTEKFIELLAGHAVKTVADVRSQPYSRFNPQFNRENLLRDLKSAGISYVFLGGELGARTEDRRCYVEGKVQYDLVARTAGFQKGLARLSQDISRRPIALMCAEKDPLTCHRAILVCRHLVTHGIVAEHILENGRLESHDDALERLLSELGIAERELFRSRDERIADAYSQRGQQIAYGDERCASEESIHGGQR